MNPPEHIVNLALDSALCSPCLSKRGVVIFKGDDHFVSGHNFKPQADPCTGDAACKATCGKRAIHAEQMALLSCLPSLRRGADMLHVKSVEGHLVPSGPPSCVECSKLALVCGIQHFWLFHSGGWHRYDIVDFHRLTLVEAPIRAINFRLDKYPQGGASSLP